MTATFFMFLVVAAVWVSTDASQNGVCVNNGVEHQVGDVWSHDCTQITCTEGGLVIEPCPWYDVSSGCVAVSGEGDEYPGCCSHEVC